jgi:hypothetical protein
MQLASGLLEERGRGGRHVTSDVHSVEIRQLTEVITTPSSNDNKKENYTTKNIVR